MAIIIATAAANNNNKKFLITQPFQGTEM